MKLILKGTFKISEARQKKVLLSLDRCSQTTLIKTTQSLQQKLVKQKYILKVNEAFIFFFFLHTGQLCYRQV